MRPATLHSLLFCAGLLCLTVVRSSDAQECQITEFAPSTLGMALCMGVKVDSLSNNLGRTTLALQTLLLRQPAQQQLGQDLMKAEAAWKTHMEIDCYLLADIQYPDNDDGENSRANDQEKSIAINSCRTDRIQQRQRFVDEMQRMLGK